MVAADLGYTAITLWSGTVGHSLPETEANLFAYAMCSFAPQQIVLTRHDLPTITHCFNQLDQLIASRNLEQLRHGRCVQRAGFSNQWSA